eukprot:PhF_6_TR16946/c0_g1_i1/m.25539/K10752/RBBP4, HAT2, CAF1, MIS16; histone-binding protein RBBP4
MIVTGSEDVAMMMNHPPEGMNNVTDETFGTGANHSTDSQRYLIWKKHVRSLYQTLFVNVVDPVTTSPTIQVLPYVRRNHKENVTEHFMLTGTCPGEGEKQAYLSILKASAPMHGGAALPFNTETGEFGGFGHAPAICRIHTELRMYHDGGIRRARFVPTNPNLLCTVSTNGNCYVFDKTEVAKSKKPNNPGRALLPVKPVLTEEESSTTNVDEASRMSSTLEAKQLRYTRALEEQRRFDAEVGKGQHKLTLSGGTASHGPAAIDIGCTDAMRTAVGFGNTVLVWSLADYQQGSAAPDTLTPMCTMQCDGIINDLKIDKVNPNLIYAACEGNDGVCMLDVRAPKLRTFGASSQYLVGVDVNPFHECLLALGNCNGEIELRDARSLDKPLVSPFLVHEPNTEVSTLSWSVHCETLLASGGEDGNVVLVNTAVPPTNGSSGCPIFKHTGHSCGVDDVSWSWVDSQKGLIASVSQGDGTMMLWKPRNRVWKEAAESCRD